MATAAADTPAKETPSPEKTADPKPAAEPKAADPKPAETTQEKTPAPQSEPERKAEPPKAPEKYALVLPEGGHVDADDLTAVESIAKQNAWTNEEAQAALDDHAAAIAARSVTFLEATTADPEYGGAKLAQTQQRAKALLEKVRPAGTPRGDALRRLLDKSGYGNHLEVISLLADLGALMDEDTPSRSGTSGDGGTKEYNSPLDLYKHTATS